MRTIITVSFFIASLSATPAQAQVPDSLDSGVRAAASFDPDSLASNHEASRRQVTVRSIAAPQKRSGLCAKISRKECSEYGAAIGALAGLVVGQFFDPKPRFERTCEIFGGCSQQCVASCSPGKYALSFAIGFAGLGAIGGSQLGRK